jgi:predicted phosphodiesterase
MPVNQMLRPPLLLENFENAHTDGRGSGKHWGWKGEKAYASVEVISKQEQPQFVRKGNHALQFNYDFRFETTEGGSRRAYFVTYAGENAHPTPDHSIKDDPNVLIIPEGEYPSHLAMWVYGDGNNAWFNGMIVDSEGTTAELPYGSAYWTGWKFIKMKIPAGMKLPFYVVYPARLLTGDKTLHGSLYIDEIMAVYGGIDFDALPPTISQMECREVDGRPGLPELCALIVDEDDEENGGVTSGVDCARTEVRIDGQPHTKNIEQRQTDKGVALCVTPDFPLCGGEHKLEITAYDKEGNQTYASTFFQVTSRTPAVGWTVAKEAEMGGTLSCRLYAEGAKPNTKVALSLGYDSGNLTPAEPFFDLAPAVTGSVTDHGGLVEIQLTTENDGNVPLLSLDFTVGSSYVAPENTVITCEKAHMEYDGASEAFCLADAEVAILPGLSLLVEKLCQGFDTVFTVTDAAGKPVSGAEVYQAGRPAYPGQTDENGKLVVSGVTDAEIDSKVDLYARKNCQYSLTTRYSISRDMGAKEPVNVHISCGADSTEMAVTWQTGVDITEGYVRYALKEEGKTALTADDLTVKAERKNNFCTYQKQSCELNGYSACLTGLQPGAEYLYQVGTEGAWSKVHTFTAFSQTGEFAFGVLADTHNRCGAAMNAALHFAPDLSFFAHAGDFVGSGIVYDDWKAYIEDAGYLHAKYPTVPVAGNHDVSDGTGINYCMIHNNPANGTKNALKGINFYTELNNTLFISIGGGDDNEKNVMDWAREVVQNSKMKWKIVLIHKGPYTCNLSSESDELRWGEFMDGLGIDLLICGHDHNFQRATIRNHKTLDVDKWISSSDGVTYLQCATSSGPSRHNWTRHRPIWNAVYESPAPSASVIRVSDEKMQITSLHTEDNADGYKIFDAFTIVK